MAASPIPEDLKVRLKASYDAIAPKYNEWTIPHSTHRLNYLNKILHLLPLADPSQSVNVLELGCGCGLPVTQKLLSYPNISVTANDLSSTQVDLARSNLLGDPVDNATAARLVLNEGDMTALSFPEASLDAVLAFYSIIHLPRTEQEELLKKVAGWLKPGGYLLANFAVEEIEGLVMDQWLDEKGWMYWSSWGEKGTVELTKRLGLEVVTGQVEEDAVDASFLWMIAKKQA
jgi:SAM-dependent methyltransferase